MAIGAVLLPLQRRRKSESSVKVAAASESSGAQKKLSFRSVGESPQHEESSTPLCSNTMSYENGCCVSYVSHRRK
jgi:hypothetical protein